MNKLEAGKSENLTNKGRGRPKGAVNRVTNEFRETVRCLLEDNSENVSRWLELVAEGDPDREIRPDPYKALDMIAKLAEYATPKLARTEMTGANGGPVHVSGISINLVRPNGN
jgi:hypothetical protein